MKMSTRSILTVLALVAITIVGVTTAQRTSDSRRGHTGFSYPGAQAQSPAGSQDRPENGESARQGQPGERGAIPGPGAGDERTGRDRPDRPLGMGYPQVERLLPPPYGPEMMQISDELKLSEAQKTAIGRLAEKHTEQVRATMEKLPPIYQQLETVMLSSSPNAESARKLVNQIYDLRAQSAAAGVDFWNSARKQLTAQQNTKLTEILKERMQRRWRFGGYYRPDTAAPPSDAGRNRREPDPGRP